MVLPLLRWPRRAGLSCSPELFSWGPPSSPTDREPPPPAPLTRRVQEGEEVSGRGIGSETPRPSAHSRKEGSWGLWLQADGHLHEQTEQINRQWSEVFILAVHSLCCACCFGDGSQGVGVMGQGCSAGHRVTWSAGLGPCGGRAGSGCGWGVAGDAPWKLKQTGSSESPDPTPAVRNPPAPAHWDAGRGPCSAF